MGLRVVGGAAIGTSGVISPAYGLGDVRPRTNSCMLRDPDMKFVTGRANVARRATVFIYVLRRISEHKGGRHYNETRKICFVYCFKTIL